MIEIVANGRCEQNAEVFSGHFVPELTQVNHAIHHLCHTETVTEVVERVVAVVLLYAQLK